MAVIDLKNTIIRMKDGGSNVEGALNFAAVTEVDGAVTPFATAGVFTITTAALSQKFYEGQRFTIESDTTVYSLSADAEAAATSISFTPALALTYAVNKDIVFEASAGVGQRELHIDGFASEDVVVGDTLNVPGSDQTYIIQARDAAVATLIGINPPLDVVVVDDAVITVSKAPNSLDIKIGEGNLTYNESRNIEYVLDRGSLDTVREGDEIPMEVSFDFTWEWIESAVGDVTPTIEEVLKNVGRASAWLSSSEDACEPFAVDIEIFNDPGCGNAGLNETRLLPDFRYESLDHDIRGGAVSVSGKCNATRAIGLRNISV